MVSGGWSGCILSRLFRHLRLQLCWRDFYFYYIHCRIDAKALLTQITRLVRNGEVEQARQICAKTKTPLSAILESALWHIISNRSLIRRFRTQWMSCFKRTAPHPAQNSLSFPFRKHFHSVGSSGYNFRSSAGIWCTCGSRSSQKAVVLAKGIAIAMNTTALGLIVAIPCMIMYSIMGSKSNTIIEEIDESSVRLLNFLFAQRRS